MTDYSWDLQQRSDQKTLFERQRSGEDRNRQFEPQEEEVPIYNA